MYFGASPPDYISLKTSLTKDGYYLTNILLYFGNMSRLSIMRNKTFFYYYTSAVVIQITDQNIKY